MLGETAESLFTLAGNEWKRPMNEKLNGYRLLHTIHGYDVFFEQHDNFLLPEVIFNGFWEA